ncbi:MFS transporter [Streptomyces synnematoformans]|uniref:MFS transporter n=1 Tax=Streptomyces synnematoformans TaxID=415721 RepID=A0ABN2XL01_9ACTN
MPKLSAVTSDDVVTSTDAAAGVDDSGRRDRRRYLTASGVALWGAQFGQIAIPLAAVTTLHAGTTGTSVLKTTLTLPFVVLGLPVGAWLDRVRRRPVMIRADLVRALALATVPAAHWAGRLTMPHLWAVVLVVGVATVFFDLGTQSYVKDLVPPARLAAVNGRLATVTQTALVCGPPLAGWAAGLLSAPTVLAATAAGYAWSALWLSRIRGAEHAGGAERAVSAAPPPRRRLRHEIAEGARFVWGQPVLRAVLLAGCLVNVGVAATTTLLPVLTLTTLHWTEAELGLFLGTGGLGGLAGALTAVPLTRRLHAGRAVLLIGAAVAPLALTFPFLGAPVPGWLAAAGWALVMYKVGFDSVVMMTFRQQVTPPHLMGRVNGTMRVLFTAAVALGGATAGLGAAVGTRWILTTAALALAAVWIPIAFSPVRAAASLDAAA